MNNDREELEIRIAAYIDGELPPADAARLEVFLANTDPKLAEQVIGMIGDKHRLGSLPKARAPEDLAPRILEQVERTTLLNNVDQFSTHHRPWWQSRAAVAAALFLVFGGFTYFILQALRTANPAWQAAMEPGAQHMPVAAESAPEAAAPLSRVAPLGPLAAAGRAATEPDGPMMAAAPVAATTAPTAAPMDSLAKAGNSAEEPVELTLVAQNADDFARLHQMIDAFRAADAGVSQQMNAQSVAGNVDRTAGVIGGKRAEQQLQYQNQNNANSENSTPPSSPPPPVTDQPRAFKADVAVPASYHLALHPAQIEQLTREFHMQNTSFGFAKTNNIASRQKDQSVSSGTTALDAANAAPDAVIDCIITMNPAAPPSPTSAPANP